MADDIGLHDTPSYDSRPPQHPDLDPEPEQSHHPDLDYEYKYSAQPDLDYELEHFQLQDENHDNVPFSLDGYVTARHTPMLVDDDQPAPDIQAGAKKYKKAVVRKIMGNFGTRGLRGAVKAFNKVPNIPLPPTTMPKIKPGAVIPRGLQIRARCTPSLIKGFPYPKEFKKCSISPADWKLFCGSIAVPLLFEPNVAYVIEEILDRVAVWDAKYFRPRGFLMRMDMPGEEAYGLDFMDIHHSHSARKHVDDLSPKPVLVGTGSGSMRQRKTSIRHQRRNRRKIFCSTRLILDPISALNDPMISRKRGWLNWQKACDFAFAAKKRLESQVVRNNEPWDWDKVPKRKDRWPPSKHLYYDRFRAKRLDIGKGDLKITVSIPAGDSMDQRGNVRQTVLPADDIEHKIIPPGHGGRIPLFHSRYCEHV